MGQSNFVAGASSIFGGRTHAITIAGHPFECVYRTIGTYAEMESFILSRRTHPLESLQQIDAKRLRPGVAELAVSRLCDLAGKAQIASNEELIEYDSSPTGWGHKLWMATRHKPEQSALISDAATGAEWFLLANADERRRLRLVLSGQIEEAPLGNSNGPQAAGGQVDEQGEASGQEPPKTPDTPGPNLPEG